MSDSSRDATRPLNGIRVVDFTTNVSGPSATAILADLGADVVKIERVGSGDDARTMLPDYHGESVFFLTLNRNKRSLAIDFSRKEGLETVKRLIETADVVVENFRRGTLEKYGLDGTTLCNQYLRLIYCSLSAYGERGDDRFKPGYDAVLQARTGIMSVTGSQVAEPSRAGVSVLDAGSGMWAAIAIITALYQRAQTGKGELVGTSLFETGIYWMGYHLTAYQATHQDPAPQGASHMAFAPYGAYQTADDLLLIGISNDTMFQKLVGVMKAPDLSNELFAHNRDRVHHREELDKLIEQKLLERSCDDWISGFDTVGIPCSRIQKVSQVLQDRQLHAVGVFQALHLSSSEKLHIPVIPVRFDNGPVDIRLDPPLLGEHSRQVLKEIGVSDDEFEKLRSQGIVQSQD